VLGSEEASSSRSVGKVKAQSSGLTKRAASDYSPAHFGLRAPVTESVFLYHRQVYLPKAAEALRAEAAQEKRLKKPQHIKHLLLEEVDPQLLQRSHKSEEQQQQQQQHQQQQQQRQQLAFLVDAGYYRKAQHQGQPPIQAQHRGLLRQGDYQGLEEVEPSSRYQQYQPQIDEEKLALLVPVEHQGA
jgi:hypothetical protein